MFVACPSVYIRKEFWKIKYKNIKIVNNNHKEDYSTVEVSFLCEGIHQDPDLCFDLFPYDVNRQQLMYRLLQQGAEVRDFKDLSYVDGYKVSLEEGENSKEEKILGYDESKKL